MCEYFNLKVQLQDSKFPWKSIGIYKFLYLRNSEMFSNYSTVKTFTIHYFIMANFRSIWNRVLRNKYHSHPHCTRESQLYGNKGSQLHKCRAMNNGRVSGERRESHSVTLQWCSCDQYKTTTLKHICDIF